MKENPVLCWFTQDFFVYFLLGKLAGFKEIKTKSCSMCIDVEIGKEEVVASEGHPVNAK